MFSCAKTGDKELKEKKQIILQFKIQIEYKINILCQETTLFSGYMFHKSLDSVHFQM